MDKIERDWIANWVGKFGLFPAIDRSEQDQGWAQFSNTFKPANGEVDNWKLSKQQNGAVLWTSQCFGWFPYRVVWILALVLNESKDPAWPYKSTDFREIFDTFFLDFTSFWLLRKVDLDAKLAVSRILIF